MLLGLSGKKESGKNTAAKFIAKKYSKNIEVEEVSFAKKLKESAAACFGIPRNEALEWCDQLKQTDNSVLASFPGDFPNALVSGREFLQNYGTEAHRDIFGADFWINAALPVDFAHNRKIVCVTDVRFENEAERIKDCGGYVIQILREDQSSQDSHASEQPLNMNLIDLIIQNNGTLDDFKSNVLAQIKTLDPLFFNYYE